MTIKTKRVHDKPESCQWHTLARMKGMVITKCSDSVDGSITANSGSFIIELCQKHLQIVNEMGIVTKKKEKEAKDMTYEEFKVEVIRRQYVGPMIDKLRNKIKYEEHYIYQILMEELMLSNTRLPEDKIDAAVKAAVEAVGEEVAARRSMTKIS